MTLTELERRVERLREQIPQANGEYRQMLEQNLALYERQLDRVLAGKHQQGATST